MCRRLLQVNVPPVLLLRKPRIQFLQPITAQFDGLLTYSKLTISTTGSAEAASHSVSPEQRKKGRLYLMTEMNAGDPPPPFYPHRQRNSLGVFLSLKQYLDGDQDVFLRLAGHSNAPVRVDGPESGLDDKDVVLALEVHSLHLQVRSHKRT